VKEPVMSENSKRIYRASVIILFREREMKFADLVNKIVVDKNGKRIGENCTCRCSFFYGK